MSRASSFTRRSALRLPAFILLIAGCAGVFAWSQGAYNIQEPPARQAAPAQTSQPDPVAPVQFTRTCSLCHGGDGLGTDRAPTLVDSAVLRGMADSDVATIIQKGKGRMPAFPLPQADIDQIVRYIRSRNLAAAAETAVPGDAKAGESIFFGEGQCSSCHTAGGRGSSYGPDLSSIASRLRPANMQQALTSPGASVGSGPGFGAAPATYNSVTVVLKDGSKLQGLNRAQGSHDLVLQTRDGKLRLLQDGEYLSVVPGSTSAMPAYQGSAGQLRDLLAYLNTLKGVGVGPLTGTLPPVTQPEIEQVAHPRQGDWPSYNGTLDGNRDSSLKQITLDNIAKLQLQWVYSIQFNGLETTPIVVDGVMFVTGNNQVYAVSGKTGREIWRYQRPKSPSAQISGDAAIGVNRGVAVLGDRVFYLTDDAHLIALDRLNGSLLWDVM